VIDGVGDGSCTSHKADLARSLDSQRVDDVAGLIDEDDPDIVPFMLVHRKAGLATEWPHRPKGGPWPQNLMLVTEPCCDFSQVALADWLTAQRAE
jgi:hypothetical protein